MVDNDEERRPPVGDGLGPRPGDDVPPADGLVGDDPLREVSPHRPPELPLEPGRPQGEDAGDVGVDPLVVEGGDSLGEPAGEADLGGADLGDVVAASEGGDLEGEDRDEESDGDDRQDPIREEPPHHDNVARTWWSVAGVLAAAAVVLGLLLALPDRGPSAEREEVEETAEKFAVALSSYDYRRLDRDLRNVREMGVGNFRYQYQQILGGDAFQTALRQNEAVATARVLKGPYLAELSDDEARTFTVLAQTVRGKAPAQPQTRNVRVESILVRTDDGWKVDWVEIT